MTRMNDWDRESYRRQRARARRIRRIRKSFICAGSLMGILMVLWGLRTVFPMEKKGYEVAKMQKSIFGNDRNGEEERGGMTESFRGEALDIPYLEELKELEKQDARVREVIEHADIYPERVLRMLANNIETLDFVLAYQEKKNVPCDTTIGETKADDRIPLLIQWDERWGYGAYGESIVGVSGCGPTCIAMVASGLTGRKDITPSAVAAYSEENGFLTSEMDTSWDLMTYGCQHYGIEGTMLGLDEQAMANTLANGYPLICSMGPGDFTENGHFIVLTSYEDGEFHVNDPNSKIRSDQTWSFEQLKDQIVNIWWYSLI